MWKRSFCPGSNQLKWLRQQFWLTKMDLKNSEYNCVAVSFGKPKTFNLTLSWSHGQKFDDFQLLIPSLNLLSMMMFLALISVIVTLILFLFRKWRINQVILNTLNVVFKTSLGHSCLLGTPWLVCKTFLSFKKIICA